MRLYYMSLQTYHKSDISTEAGQLSTSKLALLRHHEQ